MASESTLARDILRTIDELAQRDFFSEALGGTCVDGATVKTGWSVSQVQRDLADRGIITDWPVNRDGIVSEEDVRGVIDYFQCKLNDHDHLARDYASAIQTVLDFYGLTLDADPAQAPC